MCFQRWIFGQAGKQNAQNMTRGQDLPYTTLPGRPARLLSYEIIANTTRFQQIGDTVVTRRGQGLAGSLRDVPHEFHVVCELAVPCLAQVRLDVDELHRVRQPAHLASMKTSRVRCTPCEQLSPPECVFFRSVQERTLNPTSSTASPRLSLQVSAFVCHL